MATRSRTAPPVASRRAARGERLDRELRPSALDRYLLESERLVFAVRRHCTVLAGPTCLYLLLLAVAAILLGVADGSQAIATTGLVVLLGGTAWFGWKVGDWWVERFTVTDRRVLLVSGLLTRRVAIMPLRKVTDLTYERSVAGRLLGYGAFVMESAGQQQALSRIDYLPRPESLYLQMSDLLFGRGGATDDDPDDDGTEPSRRSGSPPAAGPPPAPPPAAGRPPAPPFARPAVVRGRPPLVPPPPGGATRRVPPADDAAPGRGAPAADGATTRSVAAVDVVPPRSTPRVRSEGSPPPPGATTPLPQIARDRPLARRPRGRQDVGGRGPIGE